MRCALPRTEGDVYGSLDEQVSRFAELPGPPIVVFQDLDDPAVAATFGEIMCTTYRSLIRSATSKKTYSSVIPLATHRSQKDVTT